MHYICVFAKKETFFLLLGRSQPTAGKAWIVGYDVGYSFGVFSRLDSRLRRSARLVIPTNQGERGRAGISKNVTNRHFSLLTRGPNWREGEGQGRNEQKHHKQNFFVTEGVHLPYVSVSRTIQIQFSHRLSFWKNLTKLKFKRVCHLQQKEEQKNKEKNQHHLRHFRPIS